MKCIQAVLLYTEIGNEPTVLGKGGILIFTSSFMFPYAVQRINEGFRYSASSWGF